MKRILVVWLALMSLSVQAADVKPLTLDTGVITVHDTSTDRLSVGGITGAGTIDVNGDTGVAVKANGTAVVTYTAATATVASGAELETTGTGMIDLPSQFKVANVQVSTNVTAANLGTLTGGGLTTLHKHETSTIGSLTTTSCSTGQIVYVSGENTVLPADNTNAAKAIVVGVFAGTSGQIVDTGAIDGVLVKAGDTCTPGVWVYAAETANAGKVTTTAPVTGGTFQTPVGVCLKDNGDATARIKLLIGPVKAN